LPADFEFRFTTLQVACVSRRLAIKSPLPHFWKASHKYNVRTSLLLSESAIREISPNVTTSTCLARCLLLCVHRPCFRTVIFPYWILIFLRDMPQRNSRNVVYFFSVRNAENSSGGGGVIWRAKHAMCRRRAGVRAADRS
jgi:hypothetical protein